MFLRSTSNFKTLSYLIIPEKKDSTSLISILLIPIFDVIALDFEETTKESTFFLVGWKVFSLKFLFSKLQNLENVIENLSTIFLILVELPCDYEI